MATTLSAPAASPARPSEIERPLPRSGFWRDFLTRILDPYRPELHYMRGPGPAWRAKHGASAAFRLPAARDD